jgi:uncharacterized protein YndB with AHSA1/START domain
MTFDFTLTDVIPAKPKEVYDAWLDSRLHAKMTGGQPATITAVEGEKFAVWRGFITGRNIVLDPGKRIVESWRTTQFRDADSDSQIEVLLESVVGGTRVTIHHTNVPDGLTNYRDGGWQRDYFDHMKRFFRA